MPTKDPEAIALARRAVDIKLYLAVAKQHAAREAIEQHNDAREAMGVMRPPAEWYDERSRLYVAEWRASDEVAIALEHWREFMAQYAAELVP